MEKYVNYSCQETCGMAKPCGNVHCSAHPRSIAASRRNNRKPYSRKPRTSDAANNQMNQKKEFKPSNNHQPRENRYMNRAKNHV